MKLSEIFKQSMPRGVKIQRIRTRLIDLVRKHPNDAILGKKIRAEIKDLDN